MTTPKKEMVSRDWVNLRRDKETGTESLRAHFCGHAIQAEGFTYAMLYLPQAWATEMMPRRGLPNVSALEAAFKNTLTDDPTLIFAIQ